MRFVLLVLATTLGGCAAHSGMRIPGPTRSVGSERVAYAPPAREMEEDEVYEALVEAPTRRGRAGSKVARAAVSFIGKKRIIVDGERQRYDCSGMVCAAHKKADQDLYGSSAMLFQRSKDFGVYHRKKKPHPGDVAFFDNTWDRNKNGRRDDKLTHVAIVESVDRKGNITLVHLGSRGVVRIVMNLKDPHDREDDEGNTINSVLRRGRDGGPVLSAELWRGFGSLWAVDQKRVASR